MTTTSEILLPLNSFVRMLLGLSFSFKYNTQDFELLTQLKGPPLRLCHGPRDKNPDTFRRRQLMRRLAFKGFQV